MWGGHPQEPFAMRTLLLICLCSTWNQEMVMGPDYTHVHESHEGHLLGKQGKTRQDKAKQTSSVQSRNLGLRRTPEVIGVSDSEMSFVPFFSL